MADRRVAVTGMAINTPISDELDGYIAALLGGQSAISRWRAFEEEEIYSKVGGDLSDYDAKAKLEHLKPSITDDVYGRLRQFVRRAPFSTALSTLVATDAWRDSGLAEAGLEDHALSVVVGGHNLNSRYTRQNNKTFDEEPDYIDAMFALQCLDTDHAGSVSEVLQAKGPIYTVGSACASANTALRCAVDEIQHHGIKAAVVVGPALDFSPVDLHAMAIMGAIGFQRFNEQPERASRPYDVDREGFIPAHGAAALIIEDLEAAEQRGADIYAEVLAVEARSDGNHLPTPSEEGQAAAMKAALARSNLAAEQIGFISAHATSTPLGDVTEIRSIKSVFGYHATKLKLNAPKSMLGHTCWSAPAVEAVAAILQMRARRLHPSINVDNLDPEVDLDICAGTATAYDFDHMMNNSFGFGGINCVSIFKRYDG